LKTKVILHDHFLILSEEIIQNKHEE